MVVCVYTWRELRRGSEIARSWDLVRLKKMKVGEGGGDGEDDDDVAKR